MAQDALMGSRNYRFSPYDKVQTVTKSGDKELKYLNTQATPFEISALGTLKEFGDFAEGDTQITRDGRSVQVVSCCLRGYLDLQASTHLTEMGTTVRLIVFVDTQCNGVLPVVTEVLQVASAFAFMDTNNLGRFSVLYDRTVCLNHTAGAGTAASPLWARVSVPFNVSIKDICVPIEFSGDAGTVAETTDNRMYALWIASDSLFVKCTALTGLRFFG